MTTPALTRVVPSAFNDDWVKASSTHSSPYYPWFAVNPAVQTTGDTPQRCWITASVQYGRLHVRLPSAACVRHLILENGHWYGQYTDQGMKDFTFWGSNSSSSFAETTYGTDTGWTQLATSITQLPQHVAVDQSDPVFVAVDNSDDYTYYALKISTSWGGAAYLVLRHITLLTQEIVDEQPPARLSLAMRGRPHMR